MPLLAGTVALTTAVITLGLRSRLGLGRALAIGLAAAFVTASGVGLILLDAELFALAPMLGSLWLALVAWTLMVVGLRRRWPVTVNAPADRLARRGTIALLIVLGIGTVLRLDPSPYLHGGQDQGIYVSVGHHIARTGRLRPVDRLMAGEVAGIPAAEIHAAHQIQPVPDDSPLAGVREGRWIAGLHVEDASEGRIVPAFFHLLPVWFAFTELDFGFARSTWILVLFAAASQLGAFAVGYRLGAREQTEATERRRGWMVGLVAASALALHPLDLWISTFTVTENLARAALLGSAALALEAATAERRGESGRVLLGLLAGLVFAAGAFTRGSMLALAIGLAGALVIVRRETPRSRMALLAALVAGTTLAACQAILHSWPYFFSAASNHFHVPRIRPFQADACGWALAAGFAVLVCDLGVGWLRRRWPGLDRSDRLVAILACLTLIGGLIVMTYRLLDTSDVYGHDQTVGAVLWRYSGPVGLALALVGLFAGAWRSSAREQPWVLLASAIVLISAAKQGIRYEFYYARYLVGDAIPVLVVAAAWVLVEGVRGIESRWGSQRAAIALAFGCVAWVGPGVYSLARPVYWTRDLEHGPEDLAEMFGHVPDDAVLVFDSRAPGRWRGILATPAFLSFGQTVMVYPSHRLIERAVSAGTPVYMISGGWEADHQRWGPWHTTVIARGDYRAARAEVIEGAMPEALTEWGGTWELLRIDPSIFRGTGAFSLHPDSRFIARDEPGRLETTELQLGWQPGAFVELVAKPGTLGDCHVDAVGLGNPLVAVESGADNRRFAMPPTSAPRSGTLSLVWTCPSGQAPTWWRLSMRWEPR